MNRVKNSLLKAFNYLVAIDSKNSIFHHFPNTPMAYLSALVKTSLSGYLVYTVEILKHRGYLQGLRSLEGVKRGKFALVVANGPSCNKIDWRAIAESQAQGEIEIFGLNDSILLHNDTLAGLDFLLKSDPLDKLPLQKSFDQMISKNTVNFNAKLITPSNWHSPIFFKSCKRQECLHFVDVGRNHFRSTTNPLKLRTYPPMGSLKLLAIARFMGYEKIFVIGLDNTFFHNVKLDEDFNVIQGPIHYRIDYQDSRDMSHHFPNGIGDYFHFVSQNFLALKNYFDDEIFINLDIDSLNDTFRKVGEGESQYKWLLNP
jgi:hypothetical protein